MAVAPIPFDANPAVISALWFSFDPSEDDKELWLLEQEVSSDLEKVDQKHCELYPIGKSANESYVDDDDEEEEEEDGDDEESESHEDDDDDEEIDMEIEDIDGLPTL